MPKRRILAALAVLGLVLIGRDAVRADIVTYTFSGTVDAITYPSAPNQNYVPSSIQNGSTFVGTFSFDNSASQVSGNPGIYRGTSLNLAATVTIAGQYTYTLGAPQSNDEIDLLGSSFELFGRGPTVSEPFSPNPPFNFFQFLGTTTSDVLADAQITNSSPSAGVSDAYPGGSPYYFIGANVSSVAEVPEPSSLFLIGMGAGALVLRVVKRRRAANISGHEKVSGPFLGERAL